MKDLSAYEALHKSNLFISGMLKTRNLLILSTADTAWNGHTGPGLCTGL